MANDQRKPGSISNCAWRWMMATFCALSLAGCLWAQLAAHSCAACGQATALLGGMSPAPLGIAFYAHLLAAGLWKGPGPYVLWCAVLGAAVQAVLFTALLASGILCPPCALTTVGALGLLILALSRDRQLRRGASYLLPTFVAPVAIMLVVSGSGFRKAQAAAAARREAIAHAFAMAQQEPRPAPGWVRMLIFARPGCEYCQELKEWVLPDLKREFRDRLDLDYRPAWPSLPTPTIVVTGTTVTQFSELPSSKELRNAVLRAAGR